MLSEIPTHERLGGEVAGEAGAVRCQLGAKLPCCVRRASPPRPEPFSPRSLFHCRENKIVEGSEENIKAKPLRLRWLLPSLPTLTPTLPTLLRLPLATSALLSLPSSRSRASLPAKHDADATSSPEPDSDADAPPPVGKSVAPNFDADASAFAYALDADASAFAYALDADADADANAPLHPSRDLRSAHHLSLANNAAIF